MFDGRIEQQQRALAQIVQNECREHQRIPGKANGTTAEVPHVCIERFPTGDDEKHRAQHGEPDIAIGAEERDGVTRIERARTAGSRTIHTMPSTARTANQMSMIGPKSSATVRRTSESRTARQNRNGDWHDIRLEQWRGDLETLDRAEDGDRWRDHAVAVEQRRPEDAERDQHRPAVRQSHRPPVPDFPGINAVKASTPPSP